jgi:hypothetical protein
MDRLDLELYADRLALHAARLADDLAAARLRLAWTAFERSARTRLGPDDTRRLEAAGVLAPLAIDDREHSLDGRRAQLDAVGRLQALVEEELARLGGPAGRVRGR